VGGAAAQASGLRAEEIGVVHLEEVEELGRVLDGLIQVDA
jgi:hypothetical protein